MKDPSDWQRSRNQAPGHVNVLNVKQKILVSEDASSFRQELQLKVALELTPSGFQHFNLSRTELVLAST